ncbi:MAG: hypothetical protein AAF715_32165, partial [Myxococcota bacterium]
MTLGLGAPFDRLPWEVGRAAVVAGLARRSSVPRRAWTMDIVRTPGGEELARAYPGGVRALWRRDEATGRLSERRVLTGVRVRGDGRE